MTNIFQVLTEKSYKNLLIKYKDTLIITLFSCDKIPEYTQDVATFLNISKTMQKFIFILINTNKFNKTAIILKDIPLNQTIVGIFLNKYCLVRATVANNMELLIKELVEKVNFRIEATKKTLADTTISDNTNVEKSACTDDYKKKIIVLKKLYDLKKKGYQITSDYTIHSDYDDMEWEYNLHTNPDNIIVKASYDIKDCINCDSYIDLMNENSSEPVSDELISEPESGVEVHNNIKNDKKYDEQELSKLEQIQYLRGILKQKELLKELQK